MKHTNEHIRNTQFRRQTCRRYYLANQRKQRENKNTIQEQEEEIEYSPQIMEELPSENADQDEGIGHKPEAE